MIYVVSSTSTFAPSERWDWLKKKNTMVYQILLSLLQQKWVNQLIYNTE